MENPRLVATDRIVLSYTFFEAQEEEVDKFLEVLEKERNDDLEKARQMQQDLDKPKLDPVIRASSRRRLERAQPGLSEHPAVKDINTRRNSESKESKPWVQLLPWHHGRYLTEPFCGPVTGQGFVSIPILTWHLLCDLPLSTSWFPSSYTLVSLCLAVSGARCGM